MTSRLGMVSHVGNVSVMGKAMPKPLMKQGSITGLSRISAMGGRMSVLNKQSSRKSVMNGRMSSRKKFCTKRNCCFIHYLALLQGVKIIYANIEL